MKHTKGKWIIEKEPLTTTYHLRIKKMGLESIPNEEAEANRKLIAAAPDMFKILQGVIHHNNGLKEQYKISPSLIEQIERTIKKATE